LSSEASEAYEGDVEDDDEETEEEEDDWPVRVD
jgi:hypothetical protein